MIQARQSNCPECDGQLRSTDTETVCRNCGLVVEESRIDHGPEWRSFPDDETTPERTGAPLTRSRHDRGLSTEIGKTTRVKGRKRRRLARMRVQHSRTQISSKRERNQVYAFTEIRRLTSALGLPDSAQEQACSLFDSAQGADLLRGRSLEGFAAACTYAAARAAGVARTITEVCDAAKATREEHCAAFDAMNRELGLSIGPVDPAEYLPRFASQLDLPATVERRATELAQKARRTGIISGRNPSGVAAACLYTAATECGVELTQKAAADVADVTPTTIRGTYADLMK